MSGTDRQNAIRFRSPDVQRPDPHGDYAKMPSDAPTLDDILIAIKATGFLMEQRVASFVESLGFHTWTGYPFADPEESKSREIDVRGYRQIRNEDTKLVVELELLCECKSNDNPFVF